MNDKNRNLYYLNELSDYKVAEHYADVRDWDVIDANNRTIGKVDGLLVNKEAKRVVYLNVAVDKDFIEAGHDPFDTPANEGVHEHLNKEGEEHLIIPIGMVTLDEANKKVHTTEVDHETFAKTKRYKKGTEIDRVYELAILPKYYPKTEFAIDAESDNQFYNRKEFKAK